MSAHSAAASVCNACAGEMHQLSDGPHATGYFPVRLQALREGTAIHARVPVYQITASGKYAPLCTYIETLLTMVW